MLEITIAELQKLHESEEHIEFKEAKHNYLFAGGKHVDLKDRRRCVLGCIAALANEKGGRLVLRNGRSYAPCGCWFGFCRKRSGRTHR
ncbi:hypothetical protein F2Y87_11845 [Bacteroides cellulosilyticus]|uniref:Uncharacterized protein n=1 Tax=Bacteroides cellulosilyticus TaxID=246787 RepID=A0A6L3K1G7_9BACE|nr:hypothetical protein F2Y87_11845 [Bacteroides cellulosilyticus]KAB1507829.1 hypothetical protein F8R21_07315 [Butyricimonas faecihominis]OUO01666.1 hypothetical protein B5F95_22315 [Phocaeicola dorei]WOF07879.1 hypothetical protein F1611_05460 [Butyricimonas faecihominis]